MDSPFFKDMKNKKLYSFRFDEDLISQIDELAKTFFMNRTQFITILLANEVKNNGADLCESLANPSIRDALKG